jgi:type IV secretory pathway VirB10-like protein
MTMARKIDPAKVELRASPPPVMRLSRRVIVVIAGGLAAAVLLATFWSLRSAAPRHEATSTELFNVDRVSRAEQLARLPADYSQLPPLLGEPLPGDLGTQMLRAGVSTPPEDPFSDLVAADPLNIEAEVDEGIRSPLFFALQGGGTRSSSSTGSSGLPAWPPSEAPSPFEALSALGSAIPGAGALDPGGQGRKEAFLAGGGDFATRNAGALEEPASPYQVMAGTVIPAALLTGINSDLPGQVIASVTEDVRDTATGRHVLIPQGSRLVGRYDSQVAFGQRRVLLIWTRLILPDTASIALDQLPGVDPAGYAGLEDEVDWHWGRILAGAAISTLLGVGAEMAAPDASSDEDRLLAAGRDGAQDTFSRVGQAITERNLEVQPTLTIRPGFPLRVMVHKDLVLRPYEAHGAAVAP